MTITTSQIQPKLIYLTKRKPSLSEEAWTPRWRQHGALGMSRPRWRNISRYTQSDMVRNPPAELGASTAYDGIGIVWHRSPAHRAQHILDRSSSDTMVRDEYETFAEVIVNVMLIGAEDILRTPPDGGLKLAAFLTRPAGTTREAFGASVRAALAGALDGPLGEALGVAVTLPLPPERDGRWGLDVDAVVELWFADEAAAVRARTEALFGALGGERIVVLTNEVLLHNKPVPAKKFMAWLRAPEEQDRTAFQDWCLTDWAPGMLAAHPGVLYCTVNKALTLKEAPYKPKSDPEGKGALAPNYDIVVELWADEAGTVTAALAGLGAATCHLYRVTDTLKYDKGNIPAGAPSIGIKLIGLLMFHDDMADSAVRRSWALHAPLAEKVHVGAGRYIQNWIEESVTPGAPMARGTPIMHWPSLEELMLRFADSPRGMEEIIQDTAHFVAGGSRVFAEEYVLK